MKLLFLLFSLIFITYAQAEEFILPGQRWVDNSGKEINAHGGSIIKVGGEFYWFGENRKPKGLINKVNVYSSKDLYHWDYRGVALDLSKLPIRHDLERPKVIYNEKNNEYIMWLHIELNGHYTAGKAGIATSKNIAGPYTYQGDFWPNSNIMPLYRDGDIRQSSVIKADKSFAHYFSRGQMFRDMNLFVDDNKKAYAIYESEDDDSIHIAELTNDYKSMTGKYARILVGKKNEAPAIFKRNGRYYLITSGLHGYTPTTGRLSSSKNIFGPWISHGTPFKHDGEFRVDRSFDSQPTYVFELGGEYYYMGDRWNSENLTLSTYVWLPIKWHDNLPYIEWVDSWKFNNK
ncbi:family 43 glycosylhydrolase [Pluralibacter gergoviae]|uniref:glycoside hydrolase family 43 protein n=1 Tax=Pluralibacter gergoviae TaxID=61647 RepID=UPI0006502E72|nr:glycoside hydrolase family 43 protein [Pluralibacter gergoviae]EKV0933204.1 family 43 glycosylhydrolase [Pluralibacter gergoviae]ELD4270062.1 family 43 glycosylhydrolase [Pluralibacter gergoviae]ELD4275042.1 family 43 glycosylhydrolase [Pluralibacter gergoviae]ELD4316336.1 family 43 glycosylhydrolase [Pluralibacter gergoviae]ELD4341052.1 family 43 glycosylhydrolase [Pluralibacter gergoviae]